MTRMVTGAEATGGPPKAWDRHGGHGYAPTVVTFTPSCEADHARAAALAARFGLPCGPAEGQEEEEEEGSRALAVGLQPFHFALRYSAPPGSAGATLGLYPLPRQADGQNFAAALGQAEDPAATTAARPEKKRKKKKKSPADHKPLVIDLAVICAKRGGDAKSELVVKACRPKLSSSSAGGGMVVWDLTAGLGRDGCLLAASGGWVQQVCYFERCPVVAALLGDAVDRLAGGGAGGPTVPHHGTASKLRLVAGDALEIIEAALARRAFQGEVQGGGEEEDDEDEEEEGRGAKAAEGSGSGGAPERAGAASAPASPAGAEGEPGKPVDLERRPDVCYLDPMFPARTKTALVKRDMQLLHRLIGNGEGVAGGKGEGSAAAGAAAGPGGAREDRGGRPGDEADGEDEELRLLRAACAWATRRVVVKRPKYAPPVGGAPPSFKVEGSTSRFDVYVTPSTPTAAQPK